MPKINKVNNEIVKIKSQKELLDKKMKDLEDKLNLKNKQLEELTKAEKINLLNIVIDINNYSIEELLILSKYTKEINNLFRTVLETKDIDTMLQVVNEIVAEYESSNVPAIKEVIL